MQKHRKGAWRLVSKRDRLKKEKKSCGDRCYHIFRMCALSLSYSHHSHVVFWLQGDLQHFGPGDHPLHAGRGDSFPGNAVDLVESVRFQEPLVGRPDEDL